MTIVLSNCHSALYGSNFRGGDVGQVPDEEEKKLFHAAIEPPGK